MRLRQHPAASTELDEAMAWYAERSIQAADTFWQELQRAKRLILAFPQASPRIGSQAHRFILRHYPYSIVYRVDGEEIVVLAYAHHKRRPRYWRQRLRDSHRGG